MVTVQQQVRQFIVFQFRLSTHEELTDDLSLIESGLIDSTGMMALVVFLETEFAIDIDDVEMTPDNLESISRIAAFVERKQAASLA